MNNEEFNFLKKHYKINKFYNELDQIIKAINLNKNKILEQGENYNAIILSELTNVLKKLNNNILCVYRSEFYKKSVKNIKEYNILIKDDEYIEHICLFLNLDNTNDIFNSKEGYNFISTLCRNNNEYDGPFYYKNEIKERLNNDCYNKFKEYFLKEDNLLVLNSIYKTF